MNQQYQIIVFITLLPEAACQSSTFNITEYNRHKRHMDFKYALFLTNFLSWGYCRLSPLGGDMLPEHCVGLFFM